jgi:hypothetical protein
MALGKLLTNHYFPDFSVNATDSHHQNGFVLSILQAKIPGGE